MDEINSDRQGKETGTHREVVGGERRETAVARSLRPMRELVVAGRKAVMSGVRVLRARDVGTGIRRTVTRDAAWRKR